MMLVSAITMLILPNTSRLELVYPLLFVVYYCYGTGQSVFPSTTADFFGTKNLGINLGWVFTAWVVAGIVGPMISGYMFRTYQNYTPAFGTAGILAGLAFVAIVICKEPRPQAAEARV